MASNTSRGSEKDSPDQDATTHLSTTLVGSVWQLGEGTHEVTRPGGEVVKVLTAYVLTEPGVYTCGEKQIEAV